jgi:Uma2 family endonuclease
MAIASAKPMSEAAYRRFALADPNGQWELHRGQLREKPGMSVAHGEVMIVLIEQLLNQLDPEDFRVRASHARLRRSAENYYVPDIAVVPASIVLSLLARPNSLDAYVEPLPLVIEIWSPSTGDYDVNEKVGEYQRRGDREIWRVHPIERTLTSWRRLPEGRYAESVFAGGVVYPDSLPHVAIDLDTLFARIS